MVINAGCNASLCRWPEDIMHLVSIRCPSAQPMLVVQGRVRPQWNYGMQPVRKRTIYGTVSIARRYITA